MANDSILGIFCVIFSLCNLYKKVLVSSRFLMCEGAK